MALQLAKFSYKALKNLSVQDRLAAAQDKEMGQWLLSLLTPSQFVDMFPDYYRRRMPDIGGFMAAMPTSMSRAKQEAIEEQLNNTTSGAAAGSNYKAGKWRKNWQEGVDRERATVSRRGQIPPPQLSPEQQKIFNDLKGAPIAADDPRAKMFSNLSEEQLSKVGISKTKDDKGKEIFQYTAPTVSEEDVKKYMTNSSWKGGRFDTTNYTAVLKHVGFNPEDATLMTAVGIQESNHNVKSANDKNPSRERSYGLFQINLNAHPVGSPELNYAGITSQEDLYDPVKNAKVAYYLYYKTKTGIRHWGGYTDGGYRQYLNEAQAAAGTPAGIPGDPINADYSEKSFNLMKEKLIRQREEERVGSLAKWTSTDMPATPSAAGAATGSWLGESKQCVGLSKHFSPGVGPASSWNVQNNPGGIVPGAVIATMSYNDHSGGKMAKDMPDGKSHYHTGIALTAPDAKGNVLILDQHAGRGASITSVNINDYHGERWGPVAGGAPSESSMKAINYAKTLASDEQRAFIEGKQSAATVAQVAPAAEKNVKDVSTTKKETRQDSTPPVPVAKPHGDESVASERNPAVMNPEPKKDEKKPEAKPEEKKADATPATKPPVPVAKPHGDDTPQVRSPAVLNPEPVPKVKANALGGQNRINTDQISGYSTGAAGGENVVVMNKQQKPLFTMNANESVTVDPHNDTATVTPKNKNNTIKSANNDNPMQGQINDMQDSIKELSTRFDTNKPVPELPQRHDPFPPEGGAWLNALSDVNKNTFHSPSARRAAYRTHGHDTDNDTGTNHYSHGNRS